MKKLIVILTTALLLASCGSTGNVSKQAVETSAQTSTTAAKQLTATSIAVPAPKAVNLEGGADWIPLFIQGIITTNFQQYSGLAVIDRQNADMVKAEQRLSESAEFDEKNAIELGKMTSAKLIITGSIMAKSGAYALTFSITDAESGETKATANVPNCLRSALEDGTAANQISYDLMAGYGITLGDDAKARLTQTASVMAAETSAQVSVAKGIAAEKGGSNIEALTYYIRARASDRNLSEATSRMAGMATVVAGGNFGATAKNLIKVRKDWEQLLLEAAGLIAANPPEFEVRYFTDIAPLELTEEDYANKTVSFRMGAPFLKQVSGAENAKIAAELMNAMRKIPESKAWGDKMNGFPWTYADDIPGDHWLKWANTKKVKSFPLTVALLDADKKPITKMPYKLYVEFGKKYLGFEIYNYYDSYREYLWSLPFLTSSDIPVGNADTDKIYISVEGAEKAGFSVLPTDAMPVDKAISVLEAGSHNRTVKIGGFFYERGRTDIIVSYNGTVKVDFSGESWAYDMAHVASAIESGEKFVALDLSEMINLKPERKAFDKCTSLVSVVLPDGMTKIPSFSRCWSLKSITLPVCLTEIVWGDFEDCASLESITIPWGVTEIDTRAFSGCRSLKSIIIPVSVKEIHGKEFWSCWPGIYYTGSEKQWQEIRNHEPFTWRVKAYNYNPQEAESSSDGKKKNKKKK